MAKLCFYIRGHRGRGRGFGRRSKQDKDGKTNFSEVERENSANKNSAGNFFFDCFGLC